ncbi:MAG: pyrroline-5-carboxylate reductase [Candidatus Omnitrophica bacterium]|nr:pyrroline-5-carboxylate reductase [Candidatus Omnitrophota bacterium]
MEFERDIKLGIIGCGNMGEAIAKGVVASGSIYSGNLYLYDHLTEKSSFVSGSLSANVANSSEELINSCNAILFAVKPQDAKELLREVSHLLNSSKLVISIAAGISIEKIKKILDVDVRVARVMPNMGALENQSMSALSFDSEVIDQDKRLVTQIFKSIGDVIEIEERLMDAVTAVSGSGPAYFFYLTEMLEKCAVEMGIGEDRARHLAFKTALGSAILLRDSGYNAESLRKRVTSKGGTTEAAFKVFEDRRLDGIIRDGIKAAEKRSRELSDGDK